MTALSKLIDRRAEAMGLSNRRVAERSQECPNGTVSQTTVGLYRRGEHPAEPDDAILRILSWTLDIPLPDLERAAGVPESLGEWVPPAVSSRLKPRDRALMNALVERLVEGYANDSGPAARWGDATEVEESTVHEPTAATRRESPDRPANGPAETHCGS